MIVRIFVSYSHRDREYLDRLALLESLKGLERSEAQFWWDTRIEPGSEWNTEIEREIKQADIVLALVSVHYLDSESCQKELNLCRELRRQRGLLIVPVILSPIPAGESEWLQSIETIPKLPKSIQVNYRDEGDRAALFMDLRAALRRHIERIREPLVSIPPEFDRQYEDSLGRDKDEAEVLEWIRSGQNRTVLLHGEPGVGKTTMAIRLLRQVQKQGGFERIAFRSLRNPVAVEELLRDLIAFISIGNEAPSAESLWELNSTFFDLLQGGRRVLLVLDNIETLFEYTDTKTDYSEEFRDYEYLFRLFGTRHGASIVLTSKSDLLELLPHPKPYHVRGLGVVDGARFLKTRGVRSGSGSAASYRKVVEYCGGNPTTLEMMARCIMLRGNEVDAFVAVMEREVPAAVEGLLLDELKLLGEAQRELMNWIALERGPVSTRQLEMDVVRSDVFAHISIAQCLDSLLRHHLVDVVGAGEGAAVGNAETTYALKPVFSDVMAAYLIREMVMELADTDMASMKHLCRYPLTRAQAASNVQDAQRRFMLIPVADSLVQLSGGAKEAEAALRGALDAMRARGHEEEAYGPGNIFEILYYLQSRYNMLLPSFDFSDLAMWQVNFQGKRLEGVDLSGCDFKLCRFTGLFTSVEAIAFQPDGRRWASGDVDGELRVWSTESGSELFQLQTGGRVRSVAFGPQEKGLLASGGFDRVARCWRLDADDSGEPEALHVFEGHCDWVCCVAFNSSGTLLATGSDDQTVRLWDTQTGRQVALLETGGPVTSVRFHPTRPLLASSGGNSVIDIWDCRDEGHITRLETLSGHGNWVWSLAFSPDGAYLASGSHDNTVKIWETGQWTCVRTLHGQRRWVWSVDFSPDSRTLASGGGDNTILLWNVADGTQKSRLTEHRSQVWSVAFRPGSDWVASSAEDPAIKFWDGRTGKCIRTELGYSTCNRTVAFSPAGYLAAGSDDRQVRRWKIESGEPVGPAEVAGCHAHWVRSVAFGPDGQTLASASDDHTIRVWKTWRGEPPVLRGHSARVTCVAFDSSGELLASGSDDRLIRLWDGHRFVPAGVLEGHQLRVTSLAFAGDGNLLVTGSHDRGVKLWDVSSRRALSELKIGHRVESVSLHPDGTTIAIGCEDGSVWACTLKDGGLRDPKKWVASREWVRSVAFSPDGEMLAFGGDEGRVYLYDARSGSCEAMQDEQPQRVWSVAFLGASGKLASSHQDHTIRIWDLGAREIATRLNCPRPYEGLRIDRVQGLTMAEKERLRLLGAVNSA